MPFFEEMKIAKKILLPSFDVFLLIVGFTSEDGKNQCKADTSKWQIPFTNYAILIPSNYGYSRSPREFREPCWGGHWRRKSFLTQALINLSVLAIQLRIDNSHGLQSSTKQWLTHSNFRIIVRSFSCL